MQEVKTAELPSAEAVGQWQAGLRGLFELLCQKRSWTAETGWSEHVRPAVEFQAQGALQTKDWHIEMLEGVLLGRIDAADEEHFSAAQQMYLDWLGHTPCIDALRELLEAS